MMERNNWRINYRNKMQSIDDANKNVAMIESCFCLADWNVFFFDGPLNFERCVWYAPTGPYDLDLNVTWHLIRFGQMAGMDKWR